MTELLNPNNAYAGANLIALLTLVLLGAAAFICFSGFVKYNIVLNIIKNAVGTQQIPPSIVVNVLCGLMALHSIWPSLEPGIERIRPLFIAESQTDSMLDVELTPLLDGSTDNTAKTMFDLISSPFEYFPEVLELAEYKTNKLLDIVDLPFDFDSGEDSFKYFLGSLIFDLYKGFELGLKLYMIFVSIDFLIAVVLSGVGMTMLSPTVISTPVKLAVFYFSDSWTILFKVMQ